MRVGSNIIIGEVRSSEGRKKRERKGYKTKHGIEREIERERGRRIEEAPEAEAFGFGALIRMERL